jgi:TRAP-type C4-dicarboxylate transport system permease small subunit
VSRVLKALDRVLFGAIGLLLAAMLADVAIQVFFRYVIEAPPTWTEELARFLFAWQIFLAAGLAFGRGAHIVVDVLLVMLPKAGQRLLSILSNTLVLGFLGVLVWQGVNMARLTSNTVSTAMNLNMGLVYAALPAGAAIAAVYVLLHLVEAIRGAAPAPRTSLTLVD